MSWRFDRCCTAVLCFLKKPLLQNISSTDQAHPISLHLRPTSRCWSLFINKKQRPAIGNLFACFSEECTFEYWRVFRYLLGFLLMPQYQEKLANGFTTLTGGSGLYKSESIITNLQVKKNSEDGYHFQKHWEWRILCIYCLGLQLSPLQSPQTSRLNF